MLKVLTAIQIYMSYPLVVCHAAALKEKKTRSDSVQHMYNKTLIPTENSTTNIQNKTPPKTSITQRLRTKSGQSVGVTTAM